MYFYAIFLASSLEPFTQPLMIWYSDVWFLISAVVRIRVLDAAFVLKVGPTIKDLLMAPKDKDPFLKKHGVIYRYKCYRVECDEEYIGESARNFAERFKEYLKAPSPIYDHSYISGHTFTMKISVYWEERTKTSIEP